MEMLMRQCDLRRERTRHESVRYYLTLKALSQRFECFTAFVVEILLGQLLMAFAAA